MDAEEIDREWSINFHGTNYLVSVRISASVLNIETEQTEEQSNDLQSRWKGEFSRQYIEEITLKAGSFKKYEIFVKMLISALSQESDSVFVDLLTYADLELLKARKSNIHPTQTNNTPTSSMISSSPNPKSFLKRYLILTYSGEFDRVHFPLPLGHQDTPSVQSLQRTIFRLRKQLQLSNPHKDPDGSISVPILEENGGDGTALVAQLKRENQELRHRLRLAEARASSSHAASNGRGKSPSRGPRSTSPQSHQTLEDLQSAHKKLRAQYERLRLQLAETTMQLDRQRTAKTSRSRGPSPSRVGSTGEVAADPAERTKLEGRLARLQSQLLRERADREREREAQRRALRRLQREYQEMLRGVRGADASASHGRRHLSFPLTDPHTSRRKAAADRPLSVVTSVNGSRHRTRSKGASGGQQTKTNPFVRSRSAGAADSGYFSSSTDGAGRDRGTRRMVSITGDGVSRRRSISLSSAHEQEQEELLRRGSRTRRQAAVKATQHFRHHRLSPDTSTAHSHRPAWNSGRGSASPRQPRPSGSASGVSSGTTGGASTATSTMGRRSIISIPSGTNRHTDTDRDSSSISRRGGNTRSRSSSPLNRTSSRMRDPDWGHGGGRAGNSSTGRRTPTVSEAGYSSAGSQSSVEMGGLKNSRAKSATSRAGQSQEGQIKYSSGILDEEGSFRSATSWALDGASRRGETLVVLPSDIDFPSQPHYIYGHNDGAQADSQSNSPLPVRRTSSRGSDLEGRVQTYPRSSTATEGDNVRIDLDKTTPASGAGHKFTFSSLEGVPETDKTTAEGLETSSLLDHQKERFHSKGNSSSSSLVRTETSYNHTYRTDVEGEVTGSGESREQANASLVYLPESDDHDRAERSSYASQTFEVVSESANVNSDISDIDRRIMNLQAFLDKARC